ncbi:AP2/ERF family transcription factor [Chitinimonas lacunae]|uniref:AP2/ERF family transcription factor n=1 Tax=Chitinimonas lacunae TaxID=1963018 RepID=A0ABV8MY07_9NEIS
MVSLTRRGVKVFKNFADRKYGGSEQALVAARTYRDQILQTLPPLDRREIRTIVRTNNTSGIPGVCRYLVAGRPVWAASTRLPNGRRRCRTFRIDQYGETEALRRAIEARRDLLAEIEGHFLHSQQARKLCAAHPVQAIEQLPLARPHCRGR